MPMRAPIPLPTIRAVGVASPRAHGQAITITATAAKTASESWVTSGSHSTHGRNPSAQAAKARSGPGKTSQSAKVSSASPTTAGTKKEVTLSANACTGTRLCWACSTIRITCARKVSLPTRLARTFSRPSWLMVAPITASPLPLAAGADSPVAMDSSTAMIIAATPA